MHDQRTNSPGEPAEASACKSGLGRVAYLLSGLNDRLGRNGVGASSFDLLLSLTEVGKALELTPVHVAFELKRLRAEGVIALVGRTITVRDEPRLRQLAKLTARDA